MSHQASLRIWPLMISYVFVLLLTSCKSERSSAQPARPVDIDWSLWTGPCYDDRHSCYTPDGNSEGICVAGVCMPTCPGLTYSCPSNAAVVSNEYYGCYCEPK